MTDTFSIKALSAKSLLGRILRISNGAHEIGVRIGTTATTGSSSEAVGKRTGRKSNQPRRRINVSRTAGENAILCFFHRKGGRTKTGGRVPSRNPFFLSDAESERVNEYWIKGTGELLDGSGAADSIEKAGERIGKYISAAWKKHIDDSDGPHGKLTPLKEETKKSKLRETGQSGLPPLKRTGQLQRSIGYIIKRYR